MLYFSMFNVYTERLRTTSFLVCNLLDYYISTNCTHDMCKRSPNKNKYHSTADTYDYSTDYFNDPYNCRDLNPTQVPCTCEQ